MSSATTTKATSTPAGKQKQVPGQKPVEAFDAIVIGAGHNGLTAAATLARKGKRVCVLERSDQVGGMMTDGALAPGVSAPRMAHLLYNLNATVARELGLGGRIPLRTAKLPTVSLSPDGLHTVIENGQARLSDGTAHPQAEVFAALHTRLIRFAGLLARLANQTPPKLEGGLGNAGTLSELSVLARLGLDLKLMGKKEMQEFLRVTLSNVHDLLVDELGDGPLAGAMAADAVRGAFAGPRSPGTVFSLMYRLGSPKPPGSARSAAGPGNGGGNGPVNGRGNGGGSADPVLPLDGMAAVSEAFARAARDAGAEIRCGQGAAQVLVDDEDRVTGVTLDNGQTLTAPLVLSSAGPLQTMQMAGPDHFDIEAVRRLRSLRNKGTTAKVNLLLSGTPAFTGLSPELTAGRLLIAPSSTYVERAFNPAKYNAMPTAPVVEMVLPGLSGGLNDDASSAANGDVSGDAASGQQVLSAIVNFVPPAPEKGWRATERKALLKVLLSTLEAYAPGIGKLVTASEVITPGDIAAETGAPGGHWHHLEMGLDQILTLRPTNGTAHYAFGPQGLFLCAASAHPGGDITGAPGRNSALQALKTGSA
ncbi:MAG: NAD(P)/FAD-dependent oxidoreductase [Pseudomonadota bacterium]|nr:NAD(P)/FAD-dependent oxidoreductase [Pseudomonadota bacterium]